MTNTTPSLHALLPSLLTLERMDVVPLTLPLAQEHAQRIEDLLALIPGASLPQGALFTPQRVTLGRFSLSLLALQDSLPVGVLLSYERPAEPAGLRTKGVQVYSSPSFYVDGLAVDPAFQRQGLASSLLQRWLDLTIERGFTVLDPAPPLHSLQTNSSPQNASVRRLYERFGFEVVGVKVYRDHTDLVMRRPLPALTS